MFDILSYVSARVSAHCSASNSTSRNIATSQTISHTTQYALLVVALQHRDCTIDYCDITSHCV